MPGVRFVVPRGAGWRVNAHVELCLVGVTKLLFSICGGENKELLTVRYSIAPVRLKRKVERISLVNKNVTEGFASACSTILEEVTEQSRFPSHELAVGSTVTDDPIHRHKKLTVVSLGDKMLTRSEALRILSSVCPPKPVESLADKRKCDLTYRTLTKMTNEEAIETYTLFHKWLRLWRDELWIQSGQNASQAFDALCCQSRLIRKVYITDKDISDLVNYSEGVSEGAKSHQGRTGRRVLFALRVWARSRAVLPACPTPEELGDAHAAPKSDTPQSRSPGNPEAADLLSKAGEDTPMLEELSLDDPSTSRRSRHLTPEHPSTLQSRQTLRAEASPKQPLRRTAKCSLVAAKRRCDSSAPDDGLHRPSPLANGPEEGEGPRQLLESTGSPAKISPFGGGTTLQANSNTALSSTLLSLLEEAEFPYERARAAIRAAGGFSQGPDLPSDLRSQTCTFRAERRRMLDATNVDNTPK